MKSTLNSHHVRIALDARACLPLRQGLLHNPFLDSCMLVSKQTASYLMLNPAWICFFGLSLLVSTWINLFRRQEQSFSESMKISACTSMIGLSCYLQLIVVNMECSIWASDDLQLCVDLAFPDVSSKFLFLADVAAVPAILWQSHGSAKMSHLSFGPTDLFSPQWIGARSLKLTLLTWFYIYIYMFDLFEMYCFITFGRMFFSC